MLERDHGKEVTDDPWRNAVSTARLPRSLSEKLFAAQGPMPLYFENRRGYHRYFMRGKAILLHGDSRLGVYTLDLSRQGIGILSPVPLLPKARVQIQLPKLKLMMEIARCRRLDDGCFLCGARLIAEPAPAVTSAR